MSKNFNNIDPSRQTGLTLKGWSKTLPYNDLRIAEIQDTVGAGIAISKMGTSIPTPLARLYLFDTAFAQYNNFGSNAGSLYDRLISECLDMIEFIFHYGNEIQVKDWNVRQNIDLLKNSNRLGHKRLGNNLEQFLVDLDVDNIYMFYYNGILIGGSSPYTLVFTSPNWQRRLLESGFIMQGTQGNRLFPDYAATNTPTFHLRQRHNDIRDYLTKLIAAFHNDQRFSDTAFWEYVRKSDEKAYNVLTGDNAYTDSNFCNEFSLLTCGTSINVYGAGRNEKLFFGYKKEIPVINQDGKSSNSPVGQANPASDYEIDSPKCPAGNPRPNMLNDYGLSRGKYIGDNMWKPGTVLVKNPNQPLSERVMPGPGNVKYPFLTEADFLEDRLLRLPYNVCGTDFMTFGLANYLLPLKPRFFEYFDISHINDNNTRLSFSMEAVGKDIKVTLVIPVKCRDENTMTIEKTYKGEDVVTVNNFSLALFPSYRVKKGSTIPNIYSLMRFDQASKVGTECFTIDGHDVSIIEPDALVSRNNDNVISTLKGDLFFIRVSFDDRFGIAIPKLKEVTTNINTAVVGIDFGTTNTYVCLNNDEKNDKPVPLEIDRNHRQVLTLNAIDLTEGLRGKKFSDSFSAVNAMPRALNREFAPLLLGTDSKCEVELPFRTVTCENNEFSKKQKVNLFGHINVGFNFLNEEFGAKTFEYVTDIKWALRGNHADATIRKNRLEKYCLQMAWMVKNQIMLSDNPSQAVKVILTFPYNMGSLIGKIMESWRSAFDEVLGSAATLAKKTESETPFYYLVGVKGEDYSENMLNIDIGGGTTDMLFADVEKERLLYNSTRFAGDDIWGDGLGLTKVNPGENGYVLKFEKMLKESQTIDPKHKDDYNNYKTGVEKQSKDLMSYIFRFNKRYDFESTLTSDQQLLAPLFLHIGALVYHIAQILKTKDIRVPTTINFSGMGSNYIKLISTDEEQITVFIKGLLAGFMGFGFDDRERKMPKDFRVKFEENPKIVTAQGAVISQHPNVKAFDSYERNEMYVYGFDNAPDYITYGEVKKYKEKLLDEYHRFLDVYVGNPNEQDDDVKQCQASIRRLFRPFSFRFPDGTYETLEKAAGESFVNSANRDNPDPADTIEETIFFWPLINGLYRVSKMVKK